MARRESTHLNPVGGLRFTSQNGWARPSSSAFVCGWTAWRRPLDGSCSTMRPDCIMVMRSLTEGTSARLWVTNSNGSPSRWRNACSNSITCACTETSSPRRRARRKTGAGARWPVPARRWHAGPARRTARGIGALGAGVEPRPTRAVARSAPAGAAVVRLREAPQRLADDLRHGEPGLNEARRSWKITWIPRLRCPVWSGRIAATGLPRQWTAPSSGRSSAARQRTSVLLPDPLSPTTATDSPGMTCMDTPARAVTARPARPR